MPAKPIKLNPEELYGVPTAASYLGLHISRVKAMAKDGRFGKKTAGRYLFTGAELIAFRRKQRKPGRPKSLPDKR